MTRTIVVAMFIAAGYALAAAQSAPAVPAKPMTTAPAASTVPEPQPKAVIPPAARSGEKGLPGVSTGEPIDIKRQK